MEELRATAPRSVVGFGVVLVGALGFVAGCFLPYIDNAMRLPFLESPSIVRLTTLRPATEATGTLVDLFVGPAALVLISFFGSRRPRAWTVPALISASAVWGVPRIGVLISHYTPFGGQMGVGYWLMLACVCVVILGAVVVFMSSRTARRGEE